MDSPIGSRIYNILPRDAVAVAEKTRRAREILATERFFWALVRSPRTKKLRRSSRIDGVLFYISDAEAFCEPATAIGEQTVPVRTPLNLSHSPASRKRMIAIRIRTVSEQYPAGDLIDSERLPLMTSCLVGGQWCPQESLARLRQAASCDRPGS